MEKNLSRAEFADVSVYSSQPRGLVKLHRKPDGSVVEEVRTRMRGEKWVKKNGAVMFIPMVSSQAHRRLRPEKVEAKRNRLRSRGNLKYSECPLAAGTASPDHFGQKLRHPCAAGVATEAQCCPHVEQLIGERRDRNARRRTKRIEAQKTGDKRQSEQQIELMNMLLEEKIAKAQEKASAAPAGRVAATRPSGGGGATE